MKKNDYKKKFRELNLLQAEATYQKSKHEKINKAFVKKNTTKEGTVIFYDTSDSKSPSISEADNSPDEYEKISIT